MRLIITNLSKLIKCPIILLDVVLSQPHNGVRVVHPLERTFGRLEVLQEEKSKIDVMSRFQSLHTFDILRSILYKYLEEYSQCFLKCINFMNFPGLRNIQNLCIIFY